MLHLIEPQKPLGQGFEQLSFAPVFLKRNKRRGQVRDDVARGCALSCIREELQSFYSHRYRDLRSIRNGVARPREQIRQRNRFAQ
jgi:hypothetical protein